MVAVMRDSSKDQRNCAIPSEWLSQIPEPDRTLVLDEVDGNPAFCAKLVRCMSTRTDWIHRISDCAKKAMVNEMDPARFPESRGDWPKLRARAREMAEYVKSQVASAASKLTLDQKIAIVRKIAAGTHAPAAKLSGLGDLGQWDIIGTLVGSLVGAGAGVYGAKVTSDAQQDIAKLQASSALQSAQAQIAIANANAAIMQAQSQILNPVSSVVSTLTSATIAGVPVLVPILGIIGVGLWLTFGNKR